MKHIIYNGLFITVCLGLGRVLGFFRDIIIINFFGQTYAADMAVMILTTQDLLLNFFMGSAFSLATMAGFLNHKASLRQIVYQYHKKMAIFLILITLILVLSTKIIISVMSPGLPSIYQSKLSQYLMISMISIPLTVYATIASSALNFSGFFIVSSLGNLAFNFIICCSILACFVFVDIDPFYAIAFGVLIGAFVRWGMQIFYLSSDEHVTNNKVNMRHFFKKYSTALFSTSIIFIVPIIARAFASEMGMGQISIYNFISKIIDLPVMLISGAVVTILTPLLIEKTDEQSNIKKPSIVLFLIFSLISVVLYFLSDYIVHILLIFGSFTAENKGVIAEQLKMGSTILPAYSVAFFLSTALATTKFSKIYPSLCLLILGTTYFFGQKHITSLSDIYIYMNVVYSFFVLSAGILIFCQKGSLEIKKNIHPV